MADRTSTYSVEQLYSSTLECMIENNDKFREARLSPNGPNFVMSVVKNTLRERATKGITYATDIEEDFVDNVISYRLKIGEVHYRSLKDFLQTKRRIEEICPNESGPHPARCGYRQQEIVVDPMRLNQSHFQDLSFNNNYYFIVIDTPLLGRSFSRMRIHKYLKGGMKR